MGYRGRTPSTFTDNFVRANGGIGPNYIVMPTGPSLTAINTAEGFWGVNANHGLFNNTTGANQTCHHWLCPYVTPVRVLGKTQFIELQIGLFSGGAISFGLALMATPIGDQGYFLRIQTGAPNTLQLYVSGGAGIDGLSVDPNFDAGVPWATNDIIRFSVTPGLTSNTVKSWINGVVQKTRVDASAGIPLSTGMPTLGIGQALIASNVTFNNLRCGAGEG
jgi:hypothetical protein